MIAFIIAISLSMLVEISAFGRLLGAELLLVIFAILAFARGGPNFIAIRQFYLFAGLWALGALVSDLINQSAFEDLVRGWAKIIFIVLNFTALRWLIGTDLERAVFFVFALAVASVLRLALGWSGDELGSEVFGSGWKFGYGQLFTATCMLLSAWLIQSGGLRLVAISPPFFSAALALLLNARNLTGLTVLAGLACALTAGRRTALSAKRILAIGIISIFASVMVISVYQYMASGGFLGEAAQNKYRSQYSGNLNFLQAGRTESLASTQAIIDSPIIGHGSWARDIDYVKIMLTKLEEAGIDVNWQINSDLIPSHSHLLGAWVEHGVLGAAFWAWAIIITVKGLIASLQRPGPLTGFAVFIGLSLLWDILFSPFGLERRVTTVAWLYLMILFGEKRKKTRTSNVRRIRKVGI